MASRLNHVAIASDQYALNGRFYESLFGMKPSSKPRPARSVVLGDGYVGMNVIPRRDGRTSGLDHFGIEVDDVEDTIARIAKFDSSLGAVKRPPLRRLQRARSRHQHLRSVAEEFGQAEGRLCRERLGSATHDLGYRAAYAPRRALLPVLRGRVRIGAARPAQGRQFLSLRRTRDADDHSLEDHGLLRTRPRARRARSYRLQGGVGRPGEEGHGIPDR